MSASNRFDKCPCGSDLLYSECCELFISGFQSAPTAQQLMCSRYSAYVANEIEYILTTTFPAQRADYDLKSIRQWSENSEWQQLEIIAVKKGGVNDSEGWVEFKAHYKEKGIKKIHHELSYFKKFEERWYFVAGLNPGNQKNTPAVLQKVGRNEPCTCGSGKKYKKCCANSNSA